MHSYERRMRGLFVLPLKSQMIDTFGSDCEDASSLFQRQQIRNGPEIFDDAANESVFA